MLEELIVIPILFMLVIAPLWLILHYSFRFKASKSLSRADEETLAELWRQSDQLEQRIESLETILDDEAPGWRNRQ
jgi:phage shock protein B